MSSPPWDSEAADREVLAGRKRAERRMVSPHRQRQAREKDTVSDAEIARRKAADKAIRRLVNDLTEKG